MFDQDLVRTNLWDENVDRLWTEKEGETAGKRRRWRSIAWRAHVFKWMEFGVGIYLVQKLSDFVVRQAETREVDVTLTFAQAVYIIHTHLTCTNRVPSYMRVIVLL
jgi:hypothetical protein